MKIEELVGAQVREKREGRGWSQQRLGDELKAILGRPWSRQAVSLAEKGQREFGVADLLALALVLEVSPISLMLPSLNDPPHEPVEVGARLFDRDGLITAVLLAPEDHPPNPIDQDASQFLLRQMVEGFDELAPLQEKVGDQMVSLIAIYKGHTQFLKQLADKGYGLKRWEQQQ